MMFRVEQSEKGKKKMVGNMKGGENDLQMLLSQNHHFHQNSNNNPTVMNVSLSPISSGSFSGGFGSSLNDGSSPSLTPFDETMYRRTPSTSYSDFHLFNNSNENFNVFDELGLSENLCSLHIGDKISDLSRVNQFGFEKNETRPGGYPRHLFSGISPSSSNVEDYYPIESYGSNVRGLRGFQSSIHGHSTSFDDDMKVGLLGLQNVYSVGSSMGSYVARMGDNAPYCDPIRHRDKIDYLVELRKEQERGYFKERIELPSPYTGWPCMSDGLYNAHQYEFESNVDRSVLNSLHSSQMSLGGGNPINNCSILERNNREVSNTRVNPSLMPMENVGEFEVFNYEDSFIVEGTGLKCIADKKSDRRKGHKKNSLKEAATREKNQAGTCQSLSRGVCDSDLQYGSSQSGKINENGLRPRTYNPVSVQPTHNLLDEFHGCVYYVAKDQFGCRFLQKIFEEGNREDVQKIFNEIINHVVELMMDQYGNYLIQKLLNVCSEEQRTRIVLMVTNEPGAVVRISLNTHGTRAVQKLVETLKTRQQISLVVQALEPGFLDLIKDLNGNHVVQRCLQCLSKEHNKFIFDSVAKFCVEIATHRHGCCVLNRCIDQSTGKHREKLVAEISANALLLAQDAFGNYVVQYIIELKIPSAAATLVSQFEGHFVYLSMQKFSSHVVEKFLKYFEESQSKIIRELLSVPHFDRLLQDPFANYVIQSALEVTKGPLHAKLVEAVRPHTILRTSPYCKKIFSRNLLKK